MNVLVAGAAGSIGSFLCETLLARGDHVVGVDNLATGRLANISHLQSWPYWYFIQDDITDLCHEARRPYYRYDMVIDLASPASPDDFATMPIEILDTGSRGTHTLVAIAAHDRARFVLGSTSEVYGDPLIHPQPETYWGNVDPIGPRSCYDEAKRFSEALTMAYQRVHDIDPVIVRIFNTYGPRMRPDDGRVVTNFLYQALAGKPLTIYGDGSQTRSFCYVTDLVAGLIAASHSDLVGPVNIGNPAEQTILSLAEEVLTVTGSDSPIVHVDLPPERTGDPRQRCPDISLIHDTTGWQPTVSLETGLRMMLSSVREHDRTPVSSPPHNGGLLSL